VAVHRVVEASAATPQLGVEGDTMSVVLRAGRVTATLVGPSDTVQGQYPPPATTPCTFTLTLVDASGTVPINPGDFTIIDEQGNVHYPQVSAGAGAGVTPPPAEAPAGGQITVLIRGVLPTGNGQVRWTGGGAAAIATWDFSVEID
jgi:hypothetical protein